LRKKVQIIEKKVCEIIIKMGDGIGILEIRKINALLKEKFNVDFSNRATTYYKRRLSFVLGKYRFKSFDSLLDKLEHDLNFLDVFLSDMTVPVTEMFRDPSLWRVLRKHVLPSVRDQLSYKIWLPECSTGEELYSLCIFLKEEEVLDKVSIYASSSSMDMINQAKLGVFKQNREDVNSANYDRAKSKKSLSDYYSDRNGKIQMETSLISRVNFSRVHDFERDGVKGVKMILFRNNLLYYNKTYQNVLINDLHESLLPGGFLILGNKEQLNCIEPDHKFRVFNESEKIFQKI